MRAILLLLVAAAASTTACFRADVASCAATCASSDDCPAGLVCTGAGRCAETASTVCTGGPDAAPDGVPGLITVTVRDDRGLLAAGVRVIVADPGGNLIADTSTSTNGVAMVLVPGTVDVTVVRTPSTGARLSTILAAAPGDMLVFGPERNEIPSAVRDVTWPRPTDALVYEIRSSCAILAASATDNPGFATQTLAVHTDPSCADDHDVLVVYFGALGVPPGYQILLEQPDAAVVFDGPWEPWTTSDNNLMQLPAGVPANNYQINAVNVFRDGEPARGASSFNTPIINQDMGSAPTALPPIGAAREMVTLLINNVDAMSYQQITERVSPVGEYNLAVEPAMVRWLTSAPAFDTTGRRLRWTQTTGGPSSRGGDLIATELKYSRGATTYTWRVFGPITAATPTGTPDEVELVLPDLPGSDPFELRPTDTATRAWLRVYGFQAGYGYQEARGRADAAVSGISQTNISTDAWFAEPAVTRVVASQYGL